MGLRWHSPISVVGAPSRSDGYGVVAPPRIWSRGTVTRRALLVQRRPSRSWRSETDGSDRKGRAKALKEVKDPELGLDLVVLGLIYDIEIDDAEVKATISLTSPFCPVAGQIVEDVRTAIEGVDGVDDVEVELTFEPPWTPDRIAPLIRASLGL